jgi:DNA (cytosine-5)-methyltransferase 1
MLRQAWCVLFACGETAPFTRSTWNALRDAGLLEFYRPTPKSYGRARLAGATRLMPRKMLVADLLCGAGGSSTGCARALADLGLDMELVCVNHWPVAIETHRRNHPQARHYVQDIATVRPHLLVPEGRLDLLMASPTCTHHSVARGGKPTSDQQRSDPWNIITWLTELRVKRIIIENVWEFTGWGPVDPRTGKPIKARKGEYFRAWIAALRALGFAVEWRKLNAADYGDATTRQRFILMGRSDGKSLSWPVPTHRKREQEAGSAGGAMGIRQGRLELFPGMKPWRPAREIIDWSIRGKSIFDRKKPLAPKTLARIYAGAVKFGWPEPFLVILRNHMDGKDIDGPVPTIAAKGQHIGLVQPVIVRSNMQGRLSPGARCAEDSLMTITTDGGIAVAEAVVLSQHNSGQPRSADDPLPTITTGGAAAEGHKGCARPMLIEPFILSRHAEGAPRPVSEPMPTQTTVHSPVLVAPYYGSGSGETCQSAEEPLPTLTTRGRLGMVVPVTHADGSQRARDIDSDPLPTLTTANRGELAVIVASHGERIGQSPRVHDLEQPAPTICAKGRIDMAEGIVAEDGRDHDILFRMLEPHELAAAMGFDDGAVPYDFAGTKTEKIRQIGNAVSVAKMKACVGVMMADAAPKQQAVADTNRKERAA